MRKLQITLSFVFCLVLLGFVGSAFGQSDSLINPLQRRQGQVKIEITKPLIKIENTKPLIETENTKPLKKINQNIGNFYQEPNVFSSQTLSSDSVIMLRNQLIDHFEKGEIEEVKKIKDKLWQNQEHKGQFLSYPEYWLILYWTMEYDSLLASLKYYRNESLVQSKFGSFYSILKLKSIQFRDTLSSQIESVIKPDVRKLLQLTLFELIYPETQIDKLPLFLSYGRINSSKRFLYFFNDSIVYGNKIRLKTPFLSRNKFIVDNKVYLANSVKFYNADGSFKANKHKKRRSPRFIQRVSTGVINIYAKEYKTHVTQYAYTPNSGITPNYSGREQTVLIQYYNFGYEDLKKASYRNLKRDIGHNPKSMECLNEYKKDNRIENLVIFSAAGLIITSVIISNTVGAIGFYLGLGALNVAALVIASNFKEEHLRDAMYKYNNK